MKKWLLLAAALTAVALLSRLPHPAQDIADLEPVGVIWLRPEGGNLRIETDTGAGGSGKTLTEAAEDMKAGASGEIFLDTAEFLLLHPGILITEEYAALLRPGCKVLFTAAAPDLEQAAAYLRIHPPKLTLAQLRVGAP